MTYFHCYFWTIDGVLVILMQFMAILVTNVSLYLTFEMFIEMIIED